MRRVIAIIIALALAGAGTFFLVGWVRSAEGRVLAGEILVEVLVVDEPIAAGTPAEELDGLVRPESVPAKVAAEGAVADLASLAGKVAAVDLIPGEQIVSGRFLEAEAYRRTVGGGPAIEVPADLLQVTVSLSPERVVGGELSPGDLVAVFASFDPLALDNVEPTGLAPDEIPVLIPDDGTEEESTRTGRQTPNSTAIILYGVLVTNLQAEELPRRVEDEEAVAGAPALAPTGNLLVTLALSPDDAERFIFTAEHGTIWVALEGAGVRPSSTPVQTRVSIYEAR
jgi:pilus assembly protein CpaB